jgi:uncharacterized protein
MIRLLGRALLRGALILLLVWGGIAVFQDRLLYLPAAAPLAEVIADARRQGLAPWPDEGTYRGLWREPAGPARATVILLHGNAGHAGHRYAYAEVFVRLGLRVILAEYPGYGPRPGPLGEAALVADAVETLGRVRRQFPGPLLLAGESLGAGVAAATAAAAPTEITALLLLTPWDRLEQVARHHYPWVPVGTLLRDRYDSRAHLATFRGPIAVVVAEQDRIVPPAFGRALHAALPDPKRLWVVPAADHNDWMTQVDTAWWRAVTDFLLSG